MQKQLPAKASISNCSTDKKKNCTHQAFRFN